MVSNNSAHVARLRICLTPMCALFLKFPKQFQEGDYYPHITVDETQLKESRYIAQGRGTNCWVNENSVQKSLSSCTATTLQQVAAC